MFAIVGPVPLKKLSTREPKMKISVKRSQERQTIKLFGVLADRHANELQSTFNDLFNQAQSIIVDIRAVTDIHLSILQLLRTEHRRAVSAGKEFELHVNCSKPLNK